jgi:transposase
MPALVSNPLLTGDNRWDEKAGLELDALRSQVIDALEARETRRPAMKKLTTTMMQQAFNKQDRRLTVGLDLGDRSSFGATPRSRIALETGTHSPWISRLLSELGHEAIVAHARSVRLIGESRRKDDRIDARTLARLARIDPPLLCPVKHRSAEAQADLTVIRARAALVRTRTMLVNAARGLTKSYGERLRGCNARGMKPKAAQDLSPELKSALEPMMREIESVSERICEYDHLLESMMRNRYPEAERLKQIKGVGTLIAPTYMLTLEDPHRFRKSRDAACYVGLQPGRRNSGQSEPQMHISKEGDPYLRTLLVQAAHHVLGPWGVDSDLRRWA